MKVYIAHSRNIDYCSILYEPLEGSKELIGHQLIFPHNNNADSQNARDFYKTFDLIVAEVSEPSTGLGIELGWAFDNGIPILCIYNSGSKISSSLKSVTDNFFSYSDKAEIPKIIANYIIGRG